MLRRSGAGPTLGGFAALRLDGLSGMKSPSSFRPLRRRDTPRQAPDQLNGPFERLKVPTCSAVVSSSVVGYVMLCAFVLVVAGYARLLRRRAHAGGQAARVAAPGHRPDMLGKDRISAMPRIKTVRWPAGYARFKRYKGALLRMRRQMVRGHGEPGRGYEQRS